MKQHQALATLAYGALVHDEWKRLPLFSSLPWRGAAWGMVAFGADKCRRGPAGSW